MRLDTRERVSKYLEISHKRITDTIIYNLRCRHTGETPAKRCDIYCYKHLSKEAKKGETKRCAELLAKEGYIVHRKKGKNPVIHVSMLEGKAVNDLKELMRKELIAENKRKRS